MPSMALSPKTGAPRVGQALLGLLSLSSAGVCLRLAQAHAALCGADPAAHCGWCYAAAAFGLMGAGWLVMAAARWRRAGV